MGSTEAGWGPGCVAQLTIPAHVHTPLQRPGATALPQRAGAQAARRRSSARQPASPALPPPREQHPVVALGPPSARAIAAGPGRGRRSKPSRRPLRCG
jgi:hypothetical protein